jgi:archaellum biogenesis ATPase FlaH
MESLKLHSDWLAKLLPEGLPIPSSTLISGPGGTGKPLVEFAFVADWLKAGGSLIAIPLQYPTPDLMITAMNKLYHIDLNNYSNNVVFIQFDHTIDSFQKVNDQTFLANMLKPDVWNKIVLAAEDILPVSPPGVMVFGSALNLLLFSKQFGDKILKKLYDIITFDKSRTYLFAVSTSAFADRIKILEDSCDNLMFTRVEEPMRLFYKIVRMKRVPFRKDEIQVPISKQLLDEIKKVAEETRKRKIPEIQQV